MHVRRYIPLLVTLILALLVLSQVGSRPAAALPQGWPLPELALPAGATIRDVPGSPGHPVTSSTRSWQCLVRYDGTAPTLFSQLEDNLAPLGFRRFNANGRGAQLPPGNRQYFSADGRTKLELSLQPDGVYLLRVEQGSTPQPDLYFRNLGGSGAAAKLEPLDQQPTGWR